MNQDGVLIDDPNHKNMEIQPSEHRFQFVGLLECNNSSHCNLFTFEPLMPFVSNLLSDGDIRFYILKAA